jgi:hypothetical protein
MELLRRHADDTMRAANLQKQKQVEQQDGQQI